jgi:hypothetical protein
VHFSRKVNMRLAFAANTLCVALVVIVHAALSQTVAPGAGASSAAPATATTATTATTAAAAPGSDAAAKHTKRTACLKDAKSKKLVGADKTAYLKNCIDAP